MTGYLLDTNIVSYLYDPESPYSQNISQRLTSLGDVDTVSISVLSLYEIYHGLAYRNETYPVLPDLVKSAFDILPISVEGAEIFGTLKRQYRQATGIGSKELERHNFDLILASSAIELNLTLVSNDRIFLKLSKLHGKLSLENWVA